MVLFSIGYIDITSPEKQRVALGWVVLLTTIFAMYVTVRFWANWFCAIAGYLAVRSTFLIFFIGKRGISVRTALGLIVALWLMAVLSIQFYNKRDFSRFERVSVTIAAVSLFWVVARSDGGNSTLLPVLIGTPMLLFSVSREPLKNLLHRLSR
jgi:hypothetical protein